MLTKLRFDKATSKVYCIDENGNDYAEFPVCFNTWAPHTPIRNGVFPISHENDSAMDYDAYQGPAYGKFWVALDRETGKGFHGWDEDTNRSLTSGTYGCIRASNEDGCEICRAIDETLQHQREQNKEFGIEDEPYILVDVVGDVDDSQFILGGGGEQ